MVGCLSFAHRAQRLLRVELREGVRRKSFKACQRPNPLSGRARPIRQAAERGYEANPTSSRARLIRQAAERGHAVQRPGVGVNVRGELDGDDEVGGHARGTEHALALGGLVHGARVPEVGGDGGVHY